MPRIDARHTAVGSDPDASVGRPRDLWTPGRAAEHSRNPIGHAKAAILDDMIGVGQRAIHLACRQSQHCTWSGYPPCTRRILGHTVHRSARQALSPRNRSEMVAVEFADPGIADDPDVAGVVLEKCIGVPGHHTMLRTKHAKKPVIGHGHVTNMSYPDPSHMIREHR